MTDKKTSETHYQGITGLSNLSQLVKESFIPIAKMQTEYYKESFEALQKSVESLYSVMLSSYDSEYFKNLNQIYQDLVISISDLHIPNINQEDFNTLMELDFNEEYTELSKETCSSINNLIKVCGLTDIKPIKPNKKLPSPELIIAILSLIVSLYSAFAPNPFQKQVVEQLERIYEKLDTFQPTAPQNATETFEAIHLPVK